MFYNVFDGTFKPCSINQLENAPHPSAKTNSVWYSDTHEFPNLTGISLCNDTSDKIFTGI